MHDIEHLPGIFTLGYLGENEFRTIQIDLTPWLEIIPDGIASIVHIRPGETPDDAYVAATTFEDGILSWHILAEDLGEQAGYGIMQINLNRHDTDNNQIAKSEVVKTKVNASIMDVSDGIPSAQQSLINRILDLLAKENVAIVHEPKIQNGNWFVWDPTISTYVDTQISATGPQGIKGDKGDKGDQGDPAPSSLVVPAVESWMAANITDDPTVVIDSSLSVSGAAADAATVGNMIAEGTDGLVLTVH